MNNFKKPKRNKKSTNTLDGFLPSTNLPEAQKTDVRKRFNRSYNPKQDDFQGNNEIDSSSLKSDGFHSRNVELQQPLSHSQGSNNFDLGIDDVPKKRWYRWNKHRSKKRSIRLRIARTFAVSIMALVLAVGSLFAYGYIKTQQIFRGNGEGAAALQKNVDPKKLNGEGDGRINILLLGKGGPGETAPDLTDTLLLASIDPVQNEAALLSIPRDLYVKDANQYSTKINAIYANAKQARLAKSNNGSSDEDAAEDAGLKALKQTVSEVLGIPIHYYVMVNFKAFEDAINTVGGLTVDVKEPLYDWSVAWLLDGNPLVADEGLQTFDGKRALLYARSRKGSARGDFDRTERQREIILALQKKVLSAGTFSNPLKIIELLNTFGNNVRTDLNSIDETKRLYEIGRDIGSERIISVELAEDPILVTTDFINNQSVVVPKEGLYQYDDIHNFVRNTLRDAFLKQEDARVAILNGTETAGIATAKETELKSYGYNVVLIDNAPTTNYETTKLIDLSLGLNRYTSSYLEKRLGVTATNFYIDGIPTNETVDFVIILGRDETIKTTQN